MKKNLNIAYLNGAEGMIRRGTSGGSGGSGESGGNDSNIEYLDVSQVTEKTAVIMIAQEIRFTNGGGYKIVGPPFADFMSYVYNGLDPLNTTDAIKIDYSSMICISYNHTSPISLDDFINELGITDLISSLPRLTKEQFYSLE